MAAVCGDHGGAVELLVAAGADIRAASKLPAARPTGGWQPEALPLDEAVRRGRVNALAVLLREVVAGTSGSSGLAACVLRSAGGGSQLTPTNSVIRC